MTQAMNWIIFLAALIVSWIISPWMTLGLVLGLALPRLVLLTASPYDDAALGFVNTLLGKGIDKLARWRRER